MAPTPTNRMMVNPEPVWTQNPDCLSIKSDDLSDLVYFEDVDLQSLMLQNRVANGTDHEHDMIQGLILLFDPI